MQLFCCQKFTIVQFWSSIFLRSDGERQLDCSRGQFLFEKKPSVVKTVKLGLVAQHQALGMVS